MKREEERKLKEERRERREKEERRKLTEAAENSLNVNGNEGSSFIRSQLDSFLLFFGGRSLIARALKFFHYSSTLSRTFRQCYDVFIWHSLRK